MNRQIKNLLMEARLFCYTDGTVSLYGETYCGQPEIQRFAELIVRECMKVIIDDMDSNPDDEAFNDALDHAQSIIGEHFGVEL